MCICGFWISVLDDKSGFDLIEEIRLQGPETPVIFMSARDKEFDRIIGLEKGCDDYITKPFSPKEMVLRVNNIIKRTYKDDNNRIAVDGYELDEEQRKIYADNVEIELTTKEFDLLMMFIKNKGIAFSRDKILENVWDENYFGSDRVVDDTFPSSAKKTAEFKYPYDLWIRISFRINPPFLNFLKSFL